MVLAKKANKQDRPPYHHIEAWIFTTFCRPYHHMDAWSFTTFSSGASISAG